MVTRIATVILIIGLVITGSEACNYTELTAELQELDRTYNTTPIAQFCENLSDFWQGLYRCNTTDTPKFNILREVHEAYYNCKQCRNNKTKCLQLLKGCSGGTADCCSNYEEAVNCLKNGGCATDEKIKMYTTLRDLVCAKTQDQDHCDVSKKCFASDDSQGLCQRTASALTCIEKTCPTQTANKKPSFSEIIQLTKSLCQEFSNYPTFFECKAIQSCNANVTGTPFHTPTSSEAWCSYFTGMTYCANSVVKTDSCNFGSNFAETAVAAQSTVKKTCPSTRIPCPDATVCVTGLLKVLKTSFPAVCVYIDTFVTCVDGALDECGEASKVSSQYTLRDVADNFKQFCQVVTTEPTIASCDAMNSCLVLTSVRSNGEALQKFTDQTYWSTELKRLITCVSKADCNQGDTLTNKLESLADNISELQDRDKNSAVSFGPSGLLAMFISVFLSLNIH